MVRVLMCHTSACAFRFEPYIMSHYVLHTSCCAFRFEPYIMPNYVLRVSL
jgi:hypothetical protein